MYLLFLFSVYHCHMLLFHTRFLLQRPDKYHLLMVKPPGFRQNNKDVNVYIILFQVQE